MRCHSVASFISPLALSFQRSVVATRMLQMASPLGRVARLRVGTEVADDDDFVDRCHVATSPTAHQPGNVQNAAPATIVLTDAEQLRARPRVDRPDGTIGALHRPRDGDPEQDQRRVGAEQRLRAVVLREPAAQHAAGEQPQRLHRIVDAERRALRARRRDARHQRRQQRLEQVEADEEHQQRSPDGSRPKWPIRRATPGRAEQRDRREEHRAHAPPLLGREHRRHHQHERRSAPPAGRPSSGAPARGRRRRPARAAPRRTSPSAPGAARRCRSSGARARGCAAPRAATRRRGPAPACACIRRLRRHDLQHHQDRDERQHAGEREDARHADPRYSSGASTSDSAKTRPIEAPIIAIALVRCSSRVRSAASAVTAAEIAPAPWMTRPTMVSQMSSASAAMKLPSANSSRPKTITGLRPKRSEAMPKGICSRPWVRP